MKRMQLAVGLLSLTASCVYFNSVYDARNTYAEAVRLQREGNDVSARVQFDSVIAMTGRIVSNHPESKYAVSASLMKARAELANRRPAAAVNTAKGVPTFSENKRDVDTAAGLEGVALQQLGEFEAADSSLSQALAGEISGEDRALFLFHRGMARMETGRTDLAATDLAETGIQSELSTEGRLDLARALSDVGQYAASVRLTGALVRENRFANFGQSLHLHLDTLAWRAPVLLDAALAEQLDEPQLADTKRSALFYFRGRSQERNSDTVAALEMYQSSRAAAERSRYGSLASYRAARLRILRATSPSDIVGTQSYLVTAAMTLDQSISFDARRLNERVSLFANLVEAYESRGASAAEAALRAAEVAGGDLSATSVARGLYLHYLELVPASPWAAKAIYGALLYSDTPAGDWIDDQGLSTDDRLRDLLAAIPEANPYRISIEDRVRDADTDSLYVMAERDLRRRLIEIRMLFDTTAVIVGPQDAVDAQEQQEDQQPEQEAEDDGVAF